MLDIAAEDPVDWRAVDELLAVGPVHLRFSGSRPKLTVGRRDEGPHRLFLDGGGETVLPGITTEERAVHRVTVRRFEITDGGAQGVFWFGGDDVVIEHNHVHHGRGTPAIYLEYSHRSGVTTSGFTVRGNHVHDQRGEGIYIGGSEGEDRDSHTGVAVVGNLVHDLRNPWHSKHDGINIKDRLVDVQVGYNVVARTDWGIEVASPGLYVGNTVIETQREGFQVVDWFQPFRDLKLRDNEVYDAGQHGMQIVHTAPAPGLVVEGLYVRGARGAGLLIGSETASDLRVSELFVEQAEVALDGWGDHGGVTVDACAWSGDGPGTARRFEAVDCSRPVVQSREPGGPDGVFFSGDEVPPP